MPVYNAVEEEIENQKKQTFDDIQLAVYHLLNKNPHIASDLAKQYSYICIDEAQDVSYVQYKIIEMIARQHNNLFMVGDDDQCIYQFRAAYPELLRKFVDEWKNRGAIKMVMPVNYRSSPSIVSAANNLIKNNPNYYQKNMVANQLGGEEVQYPLIEKPEEQYLQIARYAKKCLDNRLSLAVLYRDNDQAIPLIDELSRRDIPFSWSRGENKNIDEQEKILSENKGIIYFRNWCGHLRFYRICAQSIFPAGTLSFPKIL